MEKIDICEAGVGNIIYGIIDRACRDYRENPAYRGEVENFFKIIYGDSHGSAIIRALRLQVKYKEWRNSIACYTSCKNRICVHYNRISPRNHNSDTWRCPNGHTPEKIAAMREAKKKAEREAKGKVIVWEDDGRARLKADMESRQLLQETQKKYLAIMELYFSRYDTFEKESIKDFVEGVASRQPVEFLKWYIRAINNYARVSYRPDLKVKWDGEAFEWD